MQTSAAHPGNTLAGVVGMEGPTIDVAHGARGMGEISLANALVV